MAKEPIVYGQITKFSESIGIGVIEAEDGNKYRFEETDLVNPLAQLVGEDVDFLIDARRPRRIVMLSGNPWTAFGGIVARPANDLE